MLIASIPLRFSLSHTLLCWTKKALPKCNAQLNDSEADAK